MKTQRYEFDGHYVLISLQLPFEIKIYGKDGEKISGKVVTSR
jgi:hypothetical protein